MPNEVNADAADTNIVARNRIQTGPVPNWATENCFDPQYKSEHDAPITFLLSDTQIYAERRETFVHNVIRLETMEAVQHQSQWRLQFEPKTQLIVLHWLKIRRGETEINHLNLEKAHFLQREEGLERFMIHGWFTFLIILEDVRPGDILESAYTLQTHPLLLPEHGGYFFSLPTGLSVGKYYFSLQFNSARQMKWKSSAPDLKPLEGSKDGLIFWEWSGEKYVGLKPEANTPSWHISHPWIQISDFPDWPGIAAAVAKTWAAEDANETIDEMVQTIQSQEPDLPARIEKAIQLVQDECRYLSVNLELGGYVPTAPSVVARRRFGDCKDLSFLLVSLLKKLGVSARPILVNSLLKKTVGDLLPMPTLFNHAVVEFEADGKKRWVDTTLKEQGGGPFKRVIPDFGTGLPVDVAAPGLVFPPQIPDQSNLFELRENILLDTSGAPSLLAVTLKAEGGQADGFRQQLKKSGLEEMAAQRLKIIVNRFRNAKRIGALQHRDDRAANQFLLAEIFEINPFLADHPNAKLCRFQMPGNGIAGVLAMPEKGTRRTPFNLPHPCRIEYAFTVESPAIQKMKLNDPRSNLSNSFVQFSRTDKAGREFFLMDLSLATKIDFVPADQVEKHRQLVEQIWRAASRELSLLKGYSRGRQKRGFGELPTPPVKLTPFEPRPPAVQAPQTSLGRKNTPPENTPSKRRHQDKMAWWIIGAVFAIILILILIVIL